MIYKIWCTKQSDIEDVSRVLESRGYALRLLGGAEITDDLNVVIIADEEYKRVVWYYIKNDEIICTAEDFCQ